MAAPSQRKIEANRRNAARSTGPKSSEGKEKSRRNGCKHGLAAAVVVPVEEAKALETAIAAWSKQIEPADLAEEALVHQMATADVRMRRCATIAENAMEGDAIAAVRRWENRRRHSIRRKAQDLKKRPAVTVDELEASSFGCDWLIGRWTDLDSRLRLGFSWDEMKLDDALLLLGFDTPAPTAHGDPQARWLWSVAQVAAGWHLNAGDHFKPDPTVPQNWVEARQAIRQFVAEQVERLDGLRQEAWEAIDGPEAEAVAAKALMDGGKDAQARHRVLSGCPARAASGGEAPDDDPGPEAEGDRRRHRPQGRDGGGDPGGDVRPGGGRGEGRGRLAGIGRVHAADRTQGGGRQDGRGTSEAGFGQ